MFPYCHSHPLPRSDLPVPLAELSGWEEQEGDSTSSIPTSLRSAATQDTSSFGVCPGTVPGGIQERVLWLACLLPSHALGCCLEQVHTQSGSQAGAEVAA